MTLYVHVDLQECTVTSCYIGAILDDLSPALHRSPYCIAERRGGDRRAATLSNPIDGRC